MFEPHWRHCVVSLSKTHLSLLSAGSTQEDPSRHNRKIVEWDVKKTYQTKKQNYLCTLVAYFANNMDPDQTAPIGAV